MQDLRSTDQLIKDAFAVANDCIVIPNSWLPEDLHDKKRGGRTITRLNQLQDKKEGLTPFRKKKAIKARNIEIYRKQHEEGTLENQWEGEVDEMALYERQQAFAKYCPKIQFDEE